MVDRVVWGKIFNAVRNNDVFILKSVLSQRSSPETLNHGDPNWAGATPLHWASSNGLVEVAALLTEAGVNVDATDEDGWTPLHSASSNGHLEVAKLLIEAGANVNATDNDGKTPEQLALARRHKEVAALFSFTSKIQRAALQKAASDPYHQNAEQQAEQYAEQQADLQREIHRLKAALAAQQAELEQAGRLNTTLTSRVNDLERANAELTEKLASMQPQKTKDTTNCMPYNQFTGQAPQIY